MGLDKNFVVRNGLEIASDLIFADSVSNKAGIGTTTPEVKLDVSGDASVSGDFRATGIATVGGSFDVGIAGTALRVRNGGGPRYNTSRVGINTGDPEYNLEVIGDVGISSNIRVGGASTFVGLSSFYDHVHLPDTKELRFGKPEGDLILHHDGSNSYIQDTGTGSLFIEGSDKILIRDYVTDDAHVVCNKDNSVEIYYNGLKKLETLNDGIEVTGVTDTDSLVVSGIATIAQCDINSGDIDIETAFVGYSTVTNSNIVRGVVGIETVTGILHVTGTSAFDGDILFDSSNKIRYDHSESAFRFDDNAAIQFGTGSDYEIDFNGSYLAINRAVGGDIVIQSGGSSKLMIQPASVNIAPSIDNTGTVGTAANTWSGGQFTNFNIDNQLTVGGDVTIGAGPKIELKSSGSASFDGRVDVGALTVDSNLTPTSGESIEAFYSSGGYIQAYDRTNGAFKPLRIKSSNYEIGLDGSAKLAGGKLYVDSGGGFYLGLADTLDQPPYTSRNISLNASGSATFAGQITTNVDGGKFLEQYYQGTKVVQWDADGVLKIGGTPASAPNIELNSNGNATFTGNVLTGSLSSSGVQVQQNGQINIRKDSGDAITILNGGTAASNTVASIGANGSATFDGTVIVGGYSSSATNTNGARITASGQLNLQRQTGASTDNRFQILDGQTLKASIANDGSSYFSGTTDIGGTSSAPNIALNSNGSATFVGDINTTSGINVQTGSGISRINLTASTGEIFQASGSKDATQMFRIQGGRGSASQEDVVVMTSDGGITAAGKVIIEGGTDITAPSSSFASTVISRWTADYYTTGGTVASINADGSITTSGDGQFQGQVRVLPNGADTERIYVGSKTLQGFSGSNIATDVKFKLDASDGSITANGKIVAGINGNSEVRIAPNTTNAFGVINTSGVETVSLNYDGSITAGIITSVNSLSATDIYATKLYGNGENITGIDTSGNFSGKIIVAEGLIIPDTTGIATVGNITINNPAGRITATEFYGDGANLTNTGASLSATSGTQRLVTTSLTSGTMTSAGTDGDLTFNASTNTLSATNFSGNGSSLSSLNASNLSSGTVSDARLPATISSNISGSSASCTGNAATSSNCTGNAATSTNSGKASTVTITYNNNTNSNYQILWGSSDSVLGTGGVTLNPSTNIISASGFSGSGANLTSIPNSALNNSTISGKSLGSSLSTLVRGSYLTGNNYDGSSQQTWAVDATSANTVSKVVARDSSGNFSAGTITATLSGTATNATNVRVDTDSSNSSTHYVTFAEAGGGANRRMKIDGGMTFNPSSNTLTVSNLSGNASSASNATNAGKLDGYDSSQSATASTVAVRDGAGHLNVNDLNCSYVQISHAVATRNSDTRFYSGPSGNNYQYRNDATGFRASLNVPTRTGGNASGTWGISISGNAATSSNCNGNASTSSNCSGNAATSTNCNGNASTSSNCSGNSSTATTATNANNINIDEANGNTNYQVTFSPLNNGGNNRQYIDTDNSHFIYNPSTNLLSGLSYSGNGSSLTSLNASNLSSGTVADARLPGTISSNITGSSASCTGNAATSSNCNGNAATATRASDSTNVNVTATSSNQSFRMVFTEASDSTDTSGTIYKDSAANFYYNPSSNTLYAGTFSGSGASLSSLNASNISSGTISDSRLPGTISSNISGSSASCTGNAATSSNCSGNAATSTNCNGNASGNAGSSTNSRIDHDTGNAWHRLVFVGDGQNSGANARLQTDNSSSNLGYNPSSNTLRATTFSGALSGNASTSSNCNGTAAVSNNCNGNASTSSNCNGNAATSSNCNGNAATASGSNGEFSTTTLKVNGNRKVAYVSQMNLSSTYTKGLVVRSDSASRDGTVAFQAMQSDDSVPFIAYANGNTTVAELKSTGDVIADFSDMRLKDKIGNIENALDKVCSIETLMYKDNDIAKDLGYDGDRKKVGVSAQSVKKVLPEVIHRAPVDTKVDEETGEESSKTGEEYMTVDYSRLVPLLIEAIKEQQVEIEQLKSQINN